MFYIINICNQIKMCSLVCLKAKTPEKKQQKAFTMGKTNLPWGLKKYKTKLNYKIFIFGYCSLKSTDGI